MWCYTLSAGALVGGGVACRKVYMQRASKQWEMASLSIKLEQVETIADVVRILHTVAYSAATDDLMLRISNAVVDDGISESTLKVLSKLHRMYGSENGLHGYAINLVWSTVLDAIVQHNAVIIL